jgi:hypothetical protein
MKRPFDAPVKTAKKLLASAQREKAWKGLERYEVTKRLNEGPSFEEIMKGQKVSS